LKVTSDTGEIVSPSSKCEKEIVSNKITNVVLDFLVDLTDEYGSEHPHVCGRPRKLTEHGKKDCGSCVKDIEQAEQESESSGDEGAWSDQD